MQLTSLRPTADLFCSMLRDALKVELQRGQMKLVKGFVKTCYSEVLVSESSTSPDNEHEDGSLITDEKDGTTQDVAYHGGLGLKFKFPGDPKKCVTLRLRLRRIMNLLFSDFVKDRKSSCGPNI